MQDKTLSSRLALEQRTARLEQALERGVSWLARVPPSAWKNLVILLLVLWLSFSLSRLFWLLLPDPVIVPAAVAVNTPAGGAPATQSRVDIASLKSLDIFGMASQPALETPDQTGAAAGAFPPGMEDKAVDTQLNLLLVGVIASNEESSGRAIIAASGKQEVYAPGAELPAGRGVTLVRVLDSRVILDNNGRLESLWLHQDANDPRARAQLRSTPAPVDNNTGRSWSEENEVSDNAAAVFVDRGQGNDIQEASPAEINPDSEIARNLSDVVAMSIHREGGQVVGYRIRPGRNADQFAALGLQPDDIVTAVNGTPLNNPGKIMEIYNEMGNATSASLEIKRGGSVLTIDVVLQ